MLKGVDEQLQNINGVSKNIFKRRIPAGDGGASRARSWDQVWKTALEYGGGPFLCAHDC